MATEFALIHRTSERYLVYADGKHYAESPHESRATTWPDREGAEQAHMALGSFAGSWKVVEIDRPVSPTEEI